MSNICFINVFSTMQVNKAELPQSQNDACLPLKAACGQLMHILFYSYNQILRHMWHLSQCPNTEDTTKPK